MIGRPPTTGVRGPAVTGCQAPKGVNFRDETISSMCDVRGHVDGGSDDVGGAGPGSGEEYTVQGTVEAVDHAARTVTIRSKDGKVVTLDVPKDALRFEQVRVGDPVQASYYDFVSIRLKPAGEPAVDRAIEPTTVATPGSLPGATRIRQRVTTVTITGWDPVNKVVSFTGPNGAAYTRALLDTTDPKIIEGLKKGDRVDVTRTEAITVGVSQTVAVSAQSADTLRDRLTVSALFGWDNQFSGKMIQAATGRTVGGAPINLNETTYDEVYGRIGIFKIRRRLPDHSTHRGCRELRVVQ